MKSVAEPAEKTPLESPEKVAENARLRRRIAGRTARAGVWRA